MKECVLDVLVYLFENYFFAAADQATFDRESVQGELLEAGFHSTHIGKAWDWLADLQGAQPASPGVEHALRIYAPVEQEHLDVAARGFLLRLEQHGMLDAKTRELVLERALALEHAPVDLDDLKWVVLMVLYNQPGREAEFAWMHAEISGPERMH
jgi:Smg protein